MTRKWSPARVRLARRAMGVAVLAAANAGCATPPGADPRDPFESFNRGVFQFNDGVDKAVLQPAATLYRDVTPVLVRAGIGNCLGNLEDAWSFVNSLLQFKPRAAANNFMRVNVNTVMGLGGILDVASEAGIARQREDFGQTLGHWGVPSGPYLVLPLMGSYTVRDALAIPVDGAADIVGNLDHVPTRNSIKLIDLLDTRAGLLGVSSALDEVALDKYTFTRDAFLQRRRNAVYDGEPPEESSAPRPVRR